jgi:hypothetical protein
VSRDVDDLAGAFADGDDIDWDAARKKLTSPDSRRVVNGLESLSHISALPPGQPPPNLRLPLLLEAVTTLSAMWCAAGLLGYAATFELGDAVRLGVLATFAAAALSLQIGGRDHRARALAACFWTTAAGFAARGIERLTTLSPGAVSPQSLMGIRPDAFFALAVWQFARDFPNVTRFGSLDVVSAWGVRVSAVIGVTLFTAGVLPLLWPGSPLIEMLAPRRGITPAEFVFNVLVFGAAFTALAVIMWRSQKAEGLERRRVRLFLVAVALAFGPVLTLILLASVVPPLLEFFRTPRGFFLSSLVVYPPMFLLPVATAYAVAARDVLNVRLVIQRGLRYLLARWLLLWGALVPLGFLFWHLYRHKDQTVGVALTMGAAPTLLWFAGVGAVVLAFRGTLIRALDEWALPGAENRAVALAAMSERMKAARTPLEVGVALAEAIERALQAPTRAYLFVDGGMVPAEGGSAELPLESAIPSLMEGTHEPAFVSGTRRESYYTLLLDTDRTWIDTRKVEMLVPVVPGRAGSGLLGLVTLSSRRNALRYSEDDLRFVRAAAASASLACDAIASEGRADSGSADGLDEVALQCLRCGGVQGWAKDAVLCPCGGAWEPAALPKRVLQRFDLTEWLGAGGMGVVYRALDLTLGRDVALKTLPQLSSGAADRLITEARAMASLSHDDVAVLYEVARWRGTPLLVMEYLAGGTLTARLRGRRIPDAEFVALVRLLALTLGRVHARGLYHGDVKPSNIGFAADGTPKLLDFGLARALTGETAAAGAAPLGGTWAYLAPEVRDGAAPGPRLDLWALGVVLCEGLLGEHPFPRARSREEVVIGRALALSKLRRSHSSAHHQLLERVLALDPSERPANAADFAGLLAALA